MGKDYPIDEAALWGQQVDGRTRKYNDTMRKLLADAASKGFHALPGFSVEAIIAVGEEHKMALTEANAKIYEDFTKRRLKEDEIDAKVALGLAKLDLKLLEAQLDNDYDLAKAYADMKLDEYKAALERMDSDVKRRTAYIIEEKAKVEHEVNYWRGVAIDAEGIALAAEVQLINEKVKTAERKLEIIDYLYQLIAAEELVVKAEILKAQALERVIDKEEELAEIKRAMIPLHQEKAQARLKQADAIKEEVYYKKETELLGYEKIELKRQQEEAEHQVRLKEVEFDEAKMEYIRQDNLGKLAQAESRVALMKYEGEVREKVMRVKKALDKEEKRFQLDQRHFWEKYGWDQDFDWAELNRLLTVLEIVHKHQTMIITTRDKRETVLAQGEKNVVKYSAAHMHQYISKG